MSADYYAYHCHIAHVTLRLIIYATTTSCRLTFYSATARVDASRRACAHAIAYDIVLSILIYYRGDMMPRGLMPPDAAMLDAPHAAAAFFFASCRHVFAAASPRHFHV